MNQAFLERIQAILLLMTVGWLVGAPMPLSAADVSAESACAGPDGLALVAWPDARRRGCGRSTSTAALEREREHCLENQGAGSRPCFADDRRPTHLPGHGGRAKRGPVACCATTGVPANKFGRSTSIPAASIAADIRRVRRLRPRLLAMASCIFANFLNDGAIRTTALDLDGRQLWETKVSDFTTHQGFGSSPAIYKSLVIVSADNKAGGVIAGLDRRTGKIVWKQERPQQPNYTSPIILPVAGRDQLLVAGCDHLSGFDPASGQRLWEIEGSTTECVGTIVTDGQRIFASGGYPKKLTMAVKADGSGKIDWQNDIRTYVPSMLVKDGCLYTVTDAGIAFCWNSATGEELWKTRLGGTFNTSPVLVGDKLFATNQEGRTFVFKASSKAYEPIGENQLGEDVYATPVFCANRIYMRVAHGAGSDRQEWLYCLGSKAE